MRISFKRAAAIGLIAVTAVTALAIAASVLFGHTGNSGSAGTPSKPSDSSSATTPAPTPPEGAMRYQMFSQAQGYVDADPQLAPASPAGLKAVSFDAKSLTGTFTDASSQGRVFTVTAQCKNLSTDPQQSPYLQCKFSVKP
jgi:hypothetical protein